VTFARRTLTSVDDRLRACTERFAASVGSHTRSKAVDIILLLSTTCAKCRRPTRRQTPREGGGVNGPPDSTFSRGVGERAFRGRATPRLGVSGFLKIRFGSSDSTFLFDASFFFFFYLYTILKKYIYIYEFRLRVLLYRA